MRWNLLSPDVPKALSEVIPILLSNRNISDQSSFFKPGTPMQFSLAEVGIDESQVGLALARLKKAREKQEKVIIFGDYDADGITATAIAWLALREFGIEAMPFIPHREKHGYGVSDAAIDELLSAGKPDLIMTVDNGIVAHQALARLQDAGVDVIVTDHHTTELKDGQVVLPPALAVVHTTQLCGATVAWMLAKELLSAEATPNLLPELLDLCGIATIADQVPLQAANRSFAYHGILALRKTQRPGILALCQQARIIPSEISTYHVNYVLGPRINAMGRLEHGMDALRLLCTKNPSTAAELAATLSEVNSRRQELTDELLQQAITQVADQQADNILVVSSPEFHEGIIGLIAGRLSELYYKPAVAISVGSHSIKGSARSVAGVHITDLIRQLKDDLTSVGGHPGAAGFGALVENLDIVQKKLKQLAQSQIEPSLLEPTMTVDVVLPAALVSSELADELTKWEPVGQGNQKPVFAIHDLQILSVFPMGRENKHVRMVLQNGDKTPIATVGWGFGNSVAELQVGQTISIVAHIEINEYKGRRNVQLVMKDFNLKQPLS